MLKTPVEQDAVRASSPAACNAKGEIQGTAFCVVAPGWFLTAWHVVHACEGEVVLKLGDEACPACYQAELSFPEQDIAVLHAPEAPWDPLPLGRARRCRAAAFGYREDWKYYWDEADLTPSGRLETKPHSFWALNVQLGLRDTLGGVSGGPIVDLARAVVIGIAVSEARPTPTDLFCNPIDYVAMRWPALREALDLPQVAPPSAPSKEDAGELFVGREWVMAGVERWRHAAGEGGGQVLWITGPPGIGKTALAAHLCRAAGPVAAARFFGETEQSDAHGCAASLAEGLSEALPGSTALWEACAGGAGTSKPSITETFDCLLTEPLRDYQPYTGDPVLFVLDGLDEAKEVGREELAKYLAAGTKLPAWLKLIVTAAPEVNLAPHLPAVGDPRRIEMEAAGAKNKADILAYLRQEVARLGEPKASQVGEAGIWRIAERSEGLFLYVTLVLEDLRKAKKITQEQLDNLPQGLPGWYREYFEDKAPDEARYERIKPFIEVIVAAYADLTCGEIASLTGRPVQDVNRFRRLMDQVFRMVPGKDPDDHSLASQVIKPLNRSLKDWLTDEETDVRLNDLPAGRFCVSAAEGHRRLLEQGWEEYEQSDDPRQMSEYHRRYLPLHCAALEEWDKFGDLFKDPGFLSSAEGSSYAGWYRWEQTEWHDAFEKWLTYLATANPQRARLVAATTYFNAFWWWGDYVDYPFCHTVLALWDRKLKSAEDQLVLGLLRQFDTSYPKKQSYRAHATASQAWCTAKAALLDLRHRLKLEGSAAELAGGEDGAERRHLSALFDIYLAEGCQALGEEGADQYLEQALAKIEGVADDSWMTSWVLWPRAELELARGEVEQALESCRASFGKAEAPDHEVEANACRVLGDAFWAQGDRDRAWAAYTLAVHVAYHFQAEPHLPDEYSREFYLEIAARLLDRLLEFAGQDPEGARAACRSERAWWSAYWEHGPSAGALPRDDELRAWLAEGRRSELAAYLFPPAPVPGDSDYAEAVLDFVRVCKEQVEEAEKLLGLAPREDVPGE